MGYNAYLLGNGILLLSNFPQENKVEVEKIIMNEISGIPWGRVFSNFVWILGVAIILAAFSYHEFLAHIKKAKRIEVFKGDSFKKPFLVGTILIAIGISASARQLWLTAIFGIVALLLIIWSIKIIRIQATEKQEDRD